MDTDYEESLGPARRMTLSPIQREALLKLARASFVYFRSGWGPPTSGGLNCYSTQTIASLERASLAYFIGRGRSRIVKITDLGEAEAARQVS